MVWRFSDFWPFGNCNKLLFPQLVLSSLPLMFAILVQFQFGNAPQDIHLGAIIALAALGTFHPEEFSFSFFGHKFIFSES